MFYLIGLFLFLKIGYSEMYIQKQFTENMLVVCKTFVTNSDSSVSLDTSYFSSNIFCLNLHKTYLALHGLRSEQKIYNKKYIYI